MQRASIQSPLVRRSAARQSRAEQHSLLEGALARPTGQEDPTERLRGGSVSADLSPPPTNRASSFLAHQSNRRQPDASKTLPQVPIPRSGRRNSLSVAGRQRSDGFRRDREQESCSPPPSPIRVADLNCTTDHCCVVAQSLLLIRCAKRRPSVVPFT